MSLNNDELTREQVIRAGSASNKKAVSKAYDKLRFALELAHTKEELERMAETTIYQIRIAYQLEEADGSISEYQNIMLRWCDDEFVVYAPGQSGTTAGTGNTLEEDPSVIYLKAPLKTSEDLFQELKDAATAMYRKVGK